MVDCLKSFSSEIRNILKIVLSKSVLSSNKYMIFHKGISHLLLCTFTFDEEDKWDTFILLQFFKNIFVVHLPYLKCIKNLKYHFENP